MTNYSAAEKFILQKLDKELPKDLTYHGVHHTLDVLDAALKIAAYERVTDEEELNLLRIGILFHDAGFIRIYKEHEKMSCEMAREFLPLLWINGIKILTTGNGGIIFNVEHTRFDLIKEMKK